MEKPPADLVRIVIMIGTRYVQADVAIGKTDDVLDNLEYTTKEILRRNGERRTDLTSTFQQMAVEANRQKDNPKSAETILRTALWVALRGRGSKVSLDALKAQAGRACLTIKADADGKAWEFETGEIDPLEKREAGITLH